MSEASNNTENSGVHPNTDRLVIHVTDSSFDQVLLQADKPILLDFWAQWCGPCTALGKVLDEIAQEYSGRVQIVKMNVDENPKTPKKFNVRGIPTLILFQKGSVVAQKLGALSKAQLAAFLEGHL